MKNKFSSIHLYWQSLAALIIILTYFGITSDILMDAILPAIKYFLFFLVFLFSAHSYFRTGKLSEELINMRNEQTREVWSIGATSATCMAILYEKHPDIAAIWWVRSIRYSNLINNEIHTRNALSNVLKYLNAVEGLLSQDISEIHDVLNSIDQDIFKHEIKAINNVIKTIINKST